MKKILFALLALFFVNALSAAELLSTSEGTTYNVTVRVKMTYTYYSTDYRSPSNYVSSLDGGVIEQKFEVYAETPDDAEYRAKQKCASVCSYNGEYVGTRNYGGKTVHVWLERTILPARAVEAK